MNNDTGIGLFCIAAVIGLIWFVGDPPLGEAVTGLLEAVAESYRRLP